MTIDTVVGYRYRARVYCPGCVEGALCDNTYSVTHRPDQALDLLARDRGIDRSDPALDSDDFPVALHDGAVGDCADCQATLVAGAW